MAESQFCRRRVSALVEQRTQSSAARHGRRSNGILPGSPVLFGGQSVGGDLQAGARLTFGLWLDDAETPRSSCGCSATKATTRSLSANTPGTPFFAVPYNATFAPLGPQSVVIGDIANGAPGTLSSSASNDVLGGDIYYRTLLDEGCDYRFDLLGGFQYDTIHDDSDP